MKINKIREERKGKPTEGTWPGLQSLVMDVLLGVLIPLGDGIFSVFLVLYHSANQRPSSWFCGKTQAKLLPVVKKWSGPFQILTKGSIEVR